MKRKRMKKLLMAKGIGRDTADLFGKKLHIMDETGREWTNEEYAERIIPKGEANEPM